MKKNYFHKFLIVFIYVIVLKQNCFAQVLYPHAPGVEWKRTDYYPEHPLNGPQLQEESGEDWWYRHINSVNYSNNNTPNGFMCAGYSTFVNYDVDESDLDGCAELYYDENSPICAELESVDHVKGADFGVLALISPNGRERIWTEYYNFGAFNSVIQTSDGGYLAVGFTRATFTKNGDPLIYNPGQSNTAYHFLKSQVADCDDCHINLSHALLVKTNALGVVQWQYIYGMYPACDLPSGDINLTKATIAYQAFSDGWDVIETDDGYTMVGKADADEIFVQENVSLNKTENAFIIKVDINGTFVSSDFYNSSGLGSNLSESSKFTRIKKYSNNNNTYYITAGNFDPEPLTHSLALCMKFDDSSPIPLWIANVGSTHNIGCYDVEISTNASGQDDYIILLPLIEACSDCNAAANNVGEGYIYKLDGFNGTEIGTKIDISDVGTTPLHAWDLRVGITNTSDGGFAVVSSKQPNEPPESFECPYDNQITVYTNFWNTDAYVAKFIFDTDFVMEWEKTFDEDDDEPELWPGDQRKAECLYAITETEDGGLVISGNYSANFDDCYLVKLYKNCNNELTYDIDGNGSEILVSDLPGYNSPTAEIPQGTYLVRGSIHIEDGKNLIIGDGVVMKFADSKRCDVQTNIIVEPGGYLLLEGTALLTSLYDECPGSMWDGIEVWGDPNQAQGVDNDGSFEMVANATIENATMGAMADVAGYNSNGARNPSETGGGGIVTINGGHFINCRRYVHFAPLNFKQVKYNQSTIANCEFSCTGPLEDPDYQDADGTPLGVNAFITINQAQRIVIDNNTFTNSYGFLSLKRGYGIISHEAGGEFKNNHFYNLTRGIVAQYFSAVLDPVIIDNNEIDYTGIGVFVIGGGWHTIKYNDITNIPEGCLGMVLLGTDGFSVFENNLSASGEWYNIGIVVNSSGQGGGTIGRTNTFTDLYIETQTELDNPNLLIRCNIYNGYGFAWAINPYNPGSLSPQGTGIGITDFHAGNEFDNNSFEIAAPTGTTFDYYAWGSPSGTIPGGYDPNVTVIPCFGTGSDPSCAIDRSSLSINDLRTMFEDYGYILEKQQIFNFMMQKTIEVDSIENDSMSVALLIEGLAGGMDSSSIIRKLVQTFYRNGMPDSAQTWLEYLNGVDDEGFNSLFTVLNALNRSDHDLGKLSGNDTLDVFRDLAIGSNIQASVASQVILNYYYDESFNYVPEEYIPESPRIQKSVTKVSDNLISIVPNPANNLFSIFTDADLSDQNVYFNFTDVMGNKVNIPQHEISKQGYVEFDGSALNNGLYFVYITNYNNLKLASKFIIIR